MAVIGMMVAPILMYRAEVWSFTYCNKINAVQRKFCQYVLHVGLNSYAPMQMFLVNVDVLPNIWIHVWNYSYNCYLCMNKDVIKFVKETWWNG